MVCRIGLRGVLVMCCFLAATGSCLAKEVGQVISFKAGVSAQRDGQAVELALKSPVSASDVLTTNATGRAQILFDDDTTVALGSNTSLSLEKVVADGAKPAFSARLGQGVARFITGKIVEKNPDGFKVETPDATVGIRGTMFALLVDNGSTTVFVRNTTKQVFVNGVIVPSGFKITLPQGTLAPITSDDAAALDASVAVRGPSSGETAPVALQPPSVGPLPPSSLAQAPLATQHAAETVSASIVAAPVAAPVAVSPMILPVVENAYVTGNLLSGERGENGSFSFNVNLGSGAVSSGTMKSTSLESTLTGGSGSISGGALNVSGFRANAYTGSMNGTASRGVSGLSVNGNYSITNGISGDAGTFSGRQR